MKETQFASLVCKWLREQRKKGEMQHTFALEYKVVNAPKKSISFKGDFQEQQIPALLESKHSCTYKKLSDLDPSVKPYDAFQVCFAYSYVVILFYKPRQKKIMHWIDIDDWVELMENCGRKSATEAMISKISEQYVL